MLYYDNGNYIKKDNCPQTFYLREHNDAITDSSLYVIKYQSQTEDGLKTFYTYYLNAYGEKIYIYLGYEDTNKIFTNKLSSVITTQVTTLESNTDGCSAKAYLIPNDNTGAPIKFSLNTCTANRIITFSYKNTPIFKINQTYDNSGSSTTNCVGSDSSVMLPMIRSASPAFLAINGIVTSIAQSTLPSIFSGPARIVDSVNGTS